MNIFCSPRFKKEFENLIKKNSYKSLEKDIYLYFLNGSDNLLSGSRLNNSIDAPFIKKRLNGSGGYRFYFLIIIKNDNLYLSYVHPKTGVYGADNIKDEFKAEIQKEIYECIVGNDLYKITEKGTKLQFKHLKEK